jgi:uncharacterized protein (TIGR04255 family)
MICRLITGVEQHVPYPCPPTRGSAASSETWTTENDVSRRRENAPLIELIAELRWEPVPDPGASTQGPSGPTYIAAQGKAEGFFMKFAMEAHALGHGEPERLVPPGFPVISTQPVWRFRRTVDGEPKTLYQVGPGIFSANAVPPYESWSGHFRAVVAQGAAALIKTRSTDERANPFTGLTLRYLDAFDERHTEGRSIDAFMREVFKIDVSIPSAIAQHLGDGESITPMVQLQIPMEEGFVMGLSVGQGVINGRTVIMLDTSVATTLPIPCEGDAVMDAFQAAHDAISATFMQLVKPIEHLMPEVREGSQ